MRESAPDAAAPAKGMTPPEFAAFLGVKADKITSWIDAGELEAVNVANPGSTRPRWSILPQHREAFFARRSSNLKPQPKQPTPKRRKRSAPLVDYFK